MDPTSKAILLAGGGPLGPEYIGTYRFTTPRVYDSYQWQVPALTRYIFARAWGSGGEGQAWYISGGSTMFCSMFGGIYCGTDGGAGGFSEAVIPVTPGETLLIGVGTVPNNIGSNVHNGAYAYAGGFTSVFRGSTPLIIAGGGGGAGQQNHAGNGGGTNPIAGNGSPSISGSYLTGGNPNGGGGYQGGNGDNNNGGSGGSGYVGATGNLYTTTATRTAGNLNPPNNSITDYVSGHGIGGTGSPFNTNNWGSGLLVIHALGGSYNPANTPSTVIPASRTILATY